MIKQLKKEWIVQICHGYDMPFHDITRQYNRYLKILGYKVVTVYLKGIKSDHIAQYTGSDKVIFLESKTKDLKGWKHQQIKQVKTICSEYQPKFIVAQRYKSMYIGLKSSSVPVIGVCHAYGVFNRRSRRLFALLNRRRLKLLGVSNAIRDDIKRSLPFFHPDCIRTQYNHIDAEELKSQQVPKEAALKHLNLPSDHYIFGNVGRLHPDKDQESLIKAYAKVADQLGKSLLVIIGKGELEGKLKKLAFDLGVQSHIIFCGTVSNAAHYFKAFDSFVLTSDHEPFGMVILEAMAADLPVAVSNSGGAIEIIDKFKFPVGDSNEISKTLLALKSEPKNETSYNLDQFSIQKTTINFQNSLKKWELSHRKSPNEQLK